MAGDTISRRFDPKTARRYGRPTLPPHKLVIDSPRYYFSKLLYFQYLPSRPRPLWVDKRSIVVSIDGACRGNNSMDPRSRAAYGVYFGKNSPYNTYGCLDSQLPQTSTRSEIEAAIQAVEAIAELDLSDQGTTKVIIKTDSDYLHKSMTEWIWTWLETGGIGSARKEVMYWPYFRALHQRILEVECAQQIRVLFWWVPRAYNHRSDALANRALDHDDSAYGSN